jgi:hypothetical protein
VCGRRFEWSGRGRRPSVCGQRCRKRLSRSRALPVALTDAVRWCGRDGKRPVRVDDSPASSTNASTWCSYREVADRPHGVMLGDGLACWDLDGVLDLDGSVHPEAQAVLDAVGDSALWVERSMSGRGLHVFVHAPEAKGRVTGRVSFYSRARFIAVTGDRWRAALG